MENNYGKMRPYESIYDEILAKATSSQYGYTDEQVNSVQKEMYERYARYCGSAGSYYKTWLVEDWICTLLFPKEDQSHLLLNDTIEETKCKLNLVRHAAFMSCAANGSAPVFCDRFYEGVNSVAAQQWESDTVVDTGSDGS
ncbi:hypothetical protein EAF04_007022 [Stromatinia cepivora]|nr:hypothetical protein EAF04_007022 [Stromatinia cepivora]